MEIQALVDLISNYGMAFMVTIYFLYRDWKFNSTLLETMTALKDTVSALDTTVHRLHSEEQ